MTVAGQLGFTNKQIETGLLSPIIGNTYSGASLLGLAATLDIAKPGQKIMVTSFGSGAGGDSFAIEVTENIDEKRKRLDMVRDIIEKNKTYIDYSTYLKNRGSIRKV